MVLPDIPDRSCPHHAAGRQPAKKIRNKKVNHNWLRSFRNSLHCELACPRAIVLYRNASPPRARRRNHSRLCWRLPRWTARRKIQSNRQRIICTWPSYWRNGWNLYISIFHLEHELENTVFEPRNRDISHRSSDPETDARVHIRTENRNQLARLLTNGWRLWNRDGPSRSREPKRMAKQQHICCPRSHISGPTRPIWVEIVRGLVAVRP